MSEPETTTETPEAEADTTKEPSTASLLGTLAERGEEAVKRVYGELSDKPRMQDARERFGKAQHSLLTQLHIASLEEIQALRDEVASLEARLGVLEKAVAARPSSRKAAAEHD